MGVLPKSVGGGGISACEMLLVITKKSNVKSHSVPLSYSSVDGRYSVLCRG